MRIGIVEPRVAARLLKLMAEGNKYAAGVTSLGDKDVRIIIRETYQDPRNYGKVSFPMAAKSTDLRPYTKGTLIREEMDLEDDLEDDDEDEEIEDLDRVLPPEVHDRRSLRGRARRGGRGIGGGCRARTPLAALAAAVLAHAPSGALAPVLPAALPATPGRDDRRLGAT